MRSRRIIAAVIGVAAACGFPHAAVAHTKLVGTSADAKAITLTFSTRVPAHLTEVDVYSERRGKVLVGTAENPAGDERSVAVPLASEAGLGKFFVSWSTASGDDGHVVSGVFDVTVRGGGRAVVRLGTTSAQAAPAALSVARFAQDAALALAFGLAIFLAWVLPHAAPVPAALTGRLRALLIGAASVGAASAAAAVLLLGAEQVLDTRAGTSWVLAGVLWLGVLGAARRADRTFLAALLVLLIVSPALRSHGGSVLAPSVVLHVAAAGAWTGGLVALVASARSGLPVFAAVAERFGAVAVPAATAVLMTGVLQALGALDGLGALATTGYGRLVLVKLTLFAGLVALAARTRGVLIARLRTPAAVQAASAIRLAIALELVLASVALAAAGVLAGTAPPGT